MIFNHLFRFSLDTQTSFLLLMFTLTFTCSSDLAPFTFSILFHHLMSYIQSSSFSLTCLSFHLLSALIFLILNSFSILIFVFLFSHIFFQFPFSVNCASYSFSFIFCFLIIIHLVIHSFSLPFSLSISFKT